jgi:ATP-binding cassette subfamily B protein
MTAEPEIDVESLIPTRPDDRPVGVTAVILRLVSCEPVAVATALLLFSTFFLAPTVVALLVRQLFDHLANRPAALTPGTIVALLGVIEVGRWTILLASQVQFDGMWEGLLAVQRANLLRSLALDPAPAGPRLPGAPGEAISRFRDDTIDLTVVIDCWIDVAAVVLSTGITIAVLATVDARLTALITIPTFVVFPLCRRLAIRMRMLRRASREATAQVTAFLGDVFAAALAVRVAGAERAAVDRFRSLNRRRETTAVADQVAATAFQRLSGMAGEVAVGIVLLVAAPRIRSGGVTLGDVTLFVAGSLSLASLARWYGRLSAVYRQAEIAVERLAALRPDREALSVVSPTPTHIRNGPPALPLVTRSRDDLLQTVELHGLTAIHPSSGRGVRDVDLRLDRGSFTVVTGEVGSGKSTLLRAVLGLVPLAAGSISWNGDHVEHPGTWFVPPRAAYLPQVPLLCSEALLDAVMLGHAEDGGLSPEETVLHAIRLACLDDDVAEMADGLATVVGPRGVRLSGGQVQRTAAARAFVRRPELLVVDDLSSALDVATEQRLWSGLADALPGTTWLVVSHRPAVLARADSVVTLRG